VGLKKMTARAQARDYVEGFTEHQTRRGVLPAPCMVTHGNVLTLRVDLDKGFVTDHAGSAAYGQSGGTTIDALPITDLDLTHESRITEDEQLRFSMPVLILGRFRRRNRGGRTFQTVRCEA